MNQNTILQSTLRDIIFENRNKKYGAYALRKTYDTRLVMAMLTVIGISFIFCIAFLLHHNKKVFEQRTTGVITPDYKISDFHPQVIMTNKAEIKSSLSKKIPVIDHLPQIVSSVKINNLPATAREIPESITENSSTEISFPAALSGTSSNGKIKENAGSISVPAKTMPLDEAEIMPQYPGGMAALIAFLKKNLHSPKDLEAGDDVSVKVRFVVNFTGKLENFQVIQSGGVLFDNEAVRVLRKMPLWIPGKSNSENVSVFYIVPVRFTCGF